jgi:hypothetical protein
LCLGSRRLAGLKPTTVIDIRYLPEEEKRQTEAMIARLAGTTPPDEPPDKGTTS